MPKRKFSKAEERYMAFDKLRSIFIVISAILYVIDITFIVTAFQQPETPYKLLLISVCVFVLLLVIDFLVIGPKLRARGKKLYAEAYGEAAEYARTGIFAEIWDEYEFNQFEGIVDVRTKCKYISDYKNTIEIDLVRRRHEFNIQIDETCVYFLADDETDSPIEQTVPLSDLKSLGDFYDYVRKFVLEHS